MYALADFVLIVHFAFVLFVTGGLAIIWAGAAANWHWVCNRRFRILHLAAIGVVAIESLTGTACPLTTLEDALRQAHTGTGFIARWLHRMLYYDYPAWIFTVAYLLFALAVVVTWISVRPREK